MTDNSPSKSVTAFTLNGRPHDALVPGNRLLLDYLREEQGLTGTKTACDGGECGACTVLVDGQPYLSCLTLVGQVAGRHVESVESLGQGGRLAPVQEAFHLKLGAQCGACTPGFVMAAEGLLRRNNNPGEDEIRAALGSNLCRCTGYVKIIEAVRHAADAIRENAA